MIFFLCFLLTSCVNFIEQKPEITEKTPITHKKLKNYTYKVKNSFGTFSIYVQNHFFFDKEGIASFYGKDFHGKKTATGAIFNMYYYTAAHPYLPIPCIAEVTLVSKPWKKIIVKINDRGPFTKHNRLIDLSFAAAQKLGFVKQGLAKVRVKVMIKETLMLKEYGGHVQWNGETEYEKI